MDGAGGTELLSLAASLIVVVGVIVGFGWLYSRARNLGGGNADVINVVASRPLGTKERLLLVGMTASQVQTLHVFDTPVATSAASVPPGFASRLKSAIKEMRK